MRRKDLQSKLLAVVLSASMVVSLCPTTAYATEESEAENVEIETEENDPSETESLETETEEIETAEAQEEVNVLEASGEESETEGETPVESGEQEEIDQVNIDLLESLIETAEGLDQDLYDTTAKSWTDMQAELTVAKEEIAKLEDDDEGTNTSNESLAECYEHLNSALSSIEGWALMNIPYNAFYAADLNNAYDVDAFSSATLNKSRTNTSVMAAGSYHVNADGTDITGITFPVKITGVVDLSGYQKVTDNDTKTVTVTNRGTKNEQTLNGKEVLFESPSYAYYALGTAQDYYKELTVSEDGTLSFGKINGDKTVLEGVEAEFFTETEHGDYQLNLKSDTLNTENIGKIYGVIISTEEGSDYGLRHVENVWKVTELAWTTGFTTSVHGCATSSQHYEKMMGQHINAVTYYTDKGIYEVALDSIYVPVKFDYTLTVTDADVAKGKTTFKVTGLPKAYQAEYTVLDEDGEVSEIVKAAKNKITFDKTTAKTGTYTLKISDKSGVYADLSTTFEIKSSKIPAVYDEDTKALVQISENMEDEFKAYLGRITAVTIDGTSYATKDAVLIISEDGSIKTDAEPLIKEGVYDIVVKANGYADLAFTYVNAGENAQEGYSAKLTSDNYTYTGSAIKPVVKVTVTKDGKTTVVPAKFYSISYKNNVKAGTATAVVKGKGAYKDLKETLEFTIEGKNLADSDIAAVCTDMQMKDGKELTPKLTVKWGKKTLKANTDYTVSYEGDRTTAGTVTVKISGKGNYVGEASTTFRIYGQSITKAKIETEKAIYTGRFVKPKFNVTMKSGKITTTLTEGTDYTVSYSGNLNVGTAKAILTGIGTYAGTKTVSFKITAKSLTDDSVKMEVKEVASAGNKVQTSVSVKDGKTVLKEGKDYTLTTKLNKSKGIATITVKGKGNYNGQIIEDLHMVEISGESGKLTDAETVATAEELRSAIENGEKYIFLTEDIVLDSKISLQDDLYLYSNGKTITGSYEGADARLIDLNSTSDNHTIVLDHINLVGPKGANSRVLTLGANSGKIRVQIENCKLSTDYYAVNVAGGNEDIEVVVKDSTLSGYCAAQTWSANSKLTFENCTLEGINNWGEGDNAFAVVVVNDAAADSVLTFENCKISAKTNNTEYFLSKRADSQVNFNNCTFWLNDEQMEKIDNTDLYAEYGEDGMSMPDGVKITSLGNEDNKFEIVLEDKEAFIYFTQVFNREAAFEARKAAWNAGTITKYPAEKNSSELNMWYAAYTNNITVKMGCDVNLNNMTVSTFDFGTGAAFVFDGDGHTIRNAKLSASDNTKANVGFFGFDAIVTNVTLDNIHVNATGCNGAGVVYGSTNRPVNNVTVKNSSVTGAKYTGAIVGYGFSDVTNCKVENTVVCGQYKVGGAVGYDCGCDTPDYYRQITGNELTNVTVKGDNMWAGKDHYALGKVIGNWCVPKGVCKKNTFTGTTDATDYIGETDNVVELIQK